MARISGRQVECAYRVAGKSSALGAGSDIPRSAYQMSSHDVLCEMALGGGADHFIVSSSPADMKVGTGSLDLILNTVPVYHHYMAYR
jgi:hypothetical protein